MGLITADHLHYLSSLIVMLFEATRGYRVGCLSPRYWAVVAVAVRRGASTVTVSPPGSLASQTLQNCGRNKLLYEVMVRAMINY
jgi:hypothetical protein